MATVSTLPGTLNFALRRSDDFSTLLDFSVSAEGCTVRSEVVSAVTGSVAAEFATSVIDAAAGQVNLALTGEQTAALAAGTYLWRNVWDQPGGVQKTMFTGYIEVV